MTTTTAPSGGETSLAPSQVASIPAAATGSGLTISPNINAPLANCVTIDATPDGYLDNARAGTPNGVANTSVSTAASALSGCLAGKKPPTQPASIVGHGGSGIIVTGAGQNPGTPTQHIGVDNISTWTPLLAPLNGTMTNVILYGCNVGAGQDGANLLYQMAQVLGANVYGPTGLIYCDGAGDFSLEPGSQWQMATPQAPPAPIAPPATPTNEQHGQIEVRLQVLNNEVITTLSQLSHAFYVPHYHWKGRTRITAAVADALARQVHWHRPFSPPGQHAALLTGRLHVAFGHGDHTTTKSFSVFNHTFVQDDDHPNTHYRIGGGWADLLA